ncbi:hypothetical protein IJ732_08595, partial [bacterium]|nr:hypothetical protein [bacterium]
KLSETDFKSKFESHLKTTGCDADAGDTNFTPNVCLADGSQFAYGTFDESCTDNICDTLTIDTNGKKGPNTAGKDRFTMNLTPNGLKALGESDTCSTGLDCGAYILAHHKLFDGEMTPATPVYANFGECKAAGADSCTITLQDGTDKKMTKIMINVLSGPSAGEKEVYVSEQLSEQESNWTTAANSSCPEGTHLPDRYELSAVAIAKQSNPLAYPDIPSSGYFWSSSEGSDNYACDVSLSNGSTNCYNGKQYGRKILCLGN